MIRLVKNVLPLTLLLMLFFNESSFAENEVRDRQALVLLHSGEDVSKLTVELNLEINCEGEFWTVKKLSPDMPLWLLQWDFDCKERNEVLEILRGKSQVALAQGNRKINFRNVLPNDPRFNDQWNLLNVNQTGGNTGADVNVTDAWEITTGGFTALGDTLVIAVIDDGLALNHEDFAGNLWVNKGEIPGNGIDDDNNGYIDDYKGWDFDAETDNLWSGWHGTPVAGILGAKGDNGKGIAGINWNIKIMGLASNVDEASVVEAYSYVLHQRKKYNQTNGAQGSLVVAVNSSWGIDGGKPEDAPLWCAMYDSMGLAGILNAGATANDNVNVDVVGDLPTACPSEFLITVTNTDKFDMKVVQAGFGETTIDLGAPGEDALSAYPLNLYFGFGGTSGATPHVAGAIALLYSTPCTVFAQTIRENPVKAARLVKEAILAGTDFLPTLENITVTGGRLNISQSLELLMDTACKEEPSSTSTVVFSKAVFTLSPNPAEEALFLTSNHSFVNQAVLRVFDLSGKDVTESLGVMAAFNSGRTLQLNVKELASGVYILRLYLGRGNHHVLKLVKL